MARTRDMIIERWAFDNELLIYPVRVDKRFYILEIKDGDKPPKRGVQKFSVKETKWADKIRELREIYYKTRVEK